MILILGSPEDGCARDTMALVQQRGQEALLVPEAQLQSALQIKWELPAPVDDSYLAFDPRATPSAGRGKRIAVRELTGVLLRLRQAFQASLAEADDCGYMRAEWSALLYGFLKSLPCPVVNRPKPGAGQRLPETRAITQALNRFGFAAPPALVTASAKTAFEFFQCHKRRVFCASPGSGGRVLLEGEKAAELFSRGAKRALRLQAAPAGQWLRVLVVGDAAFGGEAAGASALEAGKQPWRRVALPGKLARRCVGLASALELELMELSVAHDKTGDFVLAINEFPDLGLYDPALREAVTAALCKVLIGHPKSP